MLGEPVENFRDPQPFGPCTSVEATLLINETFVCNRSEGCYCVRKDPRGTPIISLEAKKKIVCHGAHSVASFCQGMNGEMSVDSLDWYNCVSLWHGS